MDRVMTDVLVIGGGGAACRAAIEAADQGVSVIMVLKNRLGESGATAYKASEMAGYNVGDGKVDLNDSPEEHHKDMLEAGAGMADPALAEIVAENALNSLKKLEEWGVFFEKDENTYLEFKSCFSNRARTHVIKGHGEPIIKASIEQIKRRVIQVYENCMVTDLLVRDGECTGALIISGNGEYCIVSAKAVIVATGGAGQIFEKNLNPKDITGDGYALGYNAGAELVNMEFMQAGIGLIYPVVNLLNAYVWSGYPEMRNALGESFLGSYLESPISEKQVMFDHSHHFPFSCRDSSCHLEVSIQKELAEGRGTGHGGVFLDLTKMTNEYVNSLDEDSGLRKMWPITSEYLYNRGVKFLEYPVEITCFAHAINGGLRIDKKCETTINGLYAAGEVAGGPHGADRLGGNMMVTCQVFGERAGKFAALAAKRKSNCQMDESYINEQIREVNSEMHRNLDICQFKKTLKESAQKNLLIRRREEGLLEFLNTIEGIRQLVEKAPAATQANLENIELSNMLTAAQLMAVAAINRKESRGSHYREDYNIKDDATYGKPIVLIKGEAKPEIK